MLLLTNFGRADQVGDILYKDSSLELELWSALLVKTTLASQAVPFLLWIELLTTEQYPLEKIDLILVSVSTQCAVKKPDQ
jgi:hypothetical protein